MASPAPATSPPRRLPSRALLRLALIGGGPLTLLGLIAAVAAVAGRQP